MLVFDRHQRPLFLFANNFTMERFKEKHENLELVEALDVHESFDKA